MEETKQTKPAELTIRRSVTGNYFWFIDPQKGDSIACCRSREHAELFVAAPDLLAALKGVVRVADRKTVEFDAARAAIAKAEGRAK